MMILDLRFALTFVLTIFYIIFLKLVNTYSYYSISTLIKSLKLFQKYWIIISLSKTLTMLNLIKID